MPEEELSGRIIGIDLGTTYSVAAVLDESASEPIVIPNAVGANKSPSIVAFTEDGEVLVGEIARRQIATNPRCTVTAVKRLMGRYYSDVEGSEEEFPFELTHEDDQLLINVRGIGYTPQQISAIILKKLRDEAEEYLGESVDRAIITVPANFDDLQREATIEAGRLAGLKVERLVNEPTAAAMAYGLGKGKEEVVAVYDFGGGTFDVSVLEVAGNAFEVMTTTGDTHLGGDDLDDLIIDLLAREFQSEHEMNLLADPLTQRRVREAAEKAKCELSTAEQTIISVPFVAYQDKVPLHLERKLTRGEFEDLIQPIVERTIDCCREALRDAHVSKSRIDKVILVGGSSRIPLVQDLVAEFFGIEPFKGVNPDEIVALGAATQGGVMAGHLEEVVLLEVTPHSLGIEVKSNRVSRIIEKNSTIPIKAAKTFTTTEDEQQIVNIHVVQGEESEASHNRSLGRFTLSGIESAPAGTPRIRVVFFINSDGVVEISATDLQSGQEKSLTVVHSFLTDEQYRAGRRAVSREARRRRRRQPAGRSAGDTGVRQSDDILQGRVLKTEKSEEEPQPAEPGVPAEASSGTGFAEVAHDSSEDSDGASPKRAADSSAGVSHPGVRVAHSVMRPPKLTAAEPPPTGQFSPTLESISQQVEQISEEASADRAEAPVGAGAEDFDPIPGEAPISMSADTGGADATEQKGAEKTRVEPAAFRFAPLIDELTAELTGRAGQPPVSIPDVLKQAAERLDQQTDNEQAVNDYRRALAATDELLDQHPRSRALLALSTGLHVFTRNPEAAHNAIQKLQQAQADTEAVVLPLYSILIERHPQYVPALQARGNLYAQMDNLENAIVDYEGVLQRETSNEQSLIRLEELYRVLLEKSPTPALEFKLVKLYLKMNRLDDAISILQRLVNNSTYEQRALKILGLCFWQKNMYYLAWQKFKQLPVTDDLKDILYRVAADMEAADQLINAKYALERILESDIGYRDVEARLKRINHRLRSQQEELAQTKIPASAEVLQDTRFVILDEINRGSMGVVYRARDKVLDEIVAIKVLNDYLCADPQAVQRFKREARAAKRLSHPNIVRIHEFYESGGKKFISMEYIEGRDLKKILIEKEKLDMAGIRDIFVQMCRALQYAHELEIVHRDIKPANVMITTQSGVKITDFGIAKILRTEDLTRSSSLIMGTPLYMAPEQIEGGTVDGRSDIYSLGIMLYESVSGGPPFTEGNIEYHHVHSQVPPLPDEVPKGLQEAIFRCVEKKADNRFQSANELLQALEALPLN